MPISMRDSSLHPPSQKDIWTIVKDVTVSVIADIHPMGHFIKRKAKSLLREQIQYGW